jgi:hypothetical protein
VHKLRPLALVSIAFVALWLAACGSGGVEHPAEEVSTPADTASIRQLDLSAAPATQTLLRQLVSGAVDEPEIIYADLTGDLNEEAVVPITSQGTLGNVAYIVLRLDAGKPEPILTRTLDRSARNGLKMSVQDGILLESAGVYGNDDPLCCPSLLRVTSFRWDGALLQVEREERVAQPSAKQ